MIRKYSVTLNGHRTSFSLEEEFHLELRAIAARRSQSLAALIAHVDGQREEGDNLSSALRVHVLKAMKVSACPSPQAGETGLLYRSLTGRVTGWAGR